MRTLLSETAEIVQAMKPCFMMSPLSVSQFLTPDMSFDVVIFDEASQVKPADAVNCIYRARQLIIAGDQKQLPPTTFFDRITMDGDEEYHEEAIDEFESVLDISKAGGFPSLPLRWHYRSQHEDLITYSNYSFYEGKLITFPAPQAVGPDIGIEVFKVDGVYRRGAARDNPIEARKVAERVLFHARQHPKLTVGVVAFSEAQASTIEHVLNQHRKDAPELDEYFTDDRLTGFFVKNLENVQGDERDIMIFSIGYGPDEVGKITMNFGPLSVAGGERRLNVAITRARRRVEIVTSILPEHFSATTHDGPRHLRRYLEFAENGITALAVDIDSDGGDVESPLEAEVLNTVRSWGYDAVPQLGVAEYRIDLALRHPDSEHSFFLAIECDGAMYHSSRVARDRDRIRQEVLERLGWTIHRVWGPAWYRDRQGEEKRLRAAIEASVRSKNSKAKAPPAARPSTVLEEVDLDAQPSWTEPYRVVYPRVSAWRAFQEPEALPIIQEAIRQVASGEAPIHREVLLRRVRGAWDLQRAGARVRDAFDLALTNSKRSGFVGIDRQGFVWLTNQKVRTVRTPTGDPDTERTVGEIPAEELSLAVANLVRDARTVEWDELTSSVARLFGWARRGNDIGEALDRVVKGLLKDGVIAQKEGRLSINNGPI